MARTARTKRYAQAIFQIARQTEEYDKWLSDLAVLSSLERNDNFYKVLQIPTLTDEDRAVLLRARFPEISTTAVNLVFLLIEKRLISLLPDISEEYRRLLDIHRGIERAEVVTVMPLDSGDTRELEEKLGAITGKRVVVTAKEDAALVGGIIVRMEGKLLDGSTRTRLEKLKKEIGQMPG